MHSYLDLFAGIRVAVIGDLMLDCYLTGEVTRISPEAPVPVMRVSSERTVPGGAANVAANLASLGISVTVAGLAGQDAARDELIAALRGLGDIDCAGIVGIPGRVTTRKLRIIGAHQQMVRVDHEDISPCSLETGELFLAAATAAIDGADCIIISDYGKGACSDEMLRAVFDQAHSAGVRVIVDPKRADLAAYRGAALLTPNRKELAEATRMPVETDEEAAAAAAKAQEMSGADILLTRSEKGMSYFPFDGGPIHLPTVAQDVFDVSGAGDTVVAVLAASLAAGIPLVDAMHLANHAAGIVVSKLGTASVTREELHAALSARQADGDFTDGRMLTVEAAIAQRWAWGRDKLTVGFTNGCFDLLHPGHISLLKEASASCDRLIVALNTDASVKRHKGQSRPIQDERARAAVAGGLKGVAAVVLFEEDTPYALIAALQPDVLFKGGDYAIADIVGADVVHARGGRVVVADFRIGNSTSSLVRAAQALLPVAANESEDGPIASNSGDTQR